MMDLNNNFRIEFFGGPSDGDTIYQHESPDEEFQVINHVSGEIHIHEYIIQWENRIQAKYIYRGVRVIA